MESIQFEKNPHPPGQALQSHLFLLDVFSFFSYGLYESECKHPRVCVHV